MNAATGTIIAFDIIAGTAAVAAGACLIAGEIMSKRATTPAAAALLAEAAADYDSDAGRASREGFDRASTDPDQAAAQFDTDGVLRDGSGG